MERNLQATKNPDVFRIVDVNGNWEKYFIKSKGIELDSVNSILDRGYFDASLERYKEITPATTRAKALSAAGVKGIKVHKAIDTILEWYSSGKQGTFNLDTIMVRNRHTHELEALTAMERICVRNWVTAWNLHNPILIAFDQPVYNISEGYCGTFDELKVLTRACGQKGCNCASIVGKVGLWDTKTSKRIRSAYGAQGAAYVNTDNIPQFFPDQSPYTKLIDYVGILRVGVNNPLGYEMRVLKDAAMTSALGRFHQVQETIPALQPLTALDTARIELIQRFAYR